MRLSFLNAISLVPWAVGTDFELCHKRGFKLWLHVSLSAEQKLKFDERVRPSGIKGLCATLHSDFPTNYQFGISGFGDRVKKGDVMTTDGCFYGVEGFVTSGWDKLIDDVYKTVLPLGTDVAESNPLEALPYIAEKFFGDYDEAAQATDELRLLIIITDRPPHYSPKSDQETDYCGLSPPSVPFKDKISCDPNTQWPDLHTIYDKMQERLIFPAVMVYNDEYISEWKYVMDNSGMPVENYVRNMTERPAPSDYRGTVQDIVAWRQCDRIMNTSSTVAPQTTTEPSTTTEPTTTTTTTTTTTSKKHTTAAAGGKSPMPAVIGSASAGVAALAAIAAYKYFTRGPAPLEVGEEGGMDTEGQLDTSDREAAVNVNEDAYNQ